MRTSSKQISTASGIFQLVGIVLKIWLVVHENTNYSKDGFQKCCLLIKVKTVRQLIWVYCSLDKERNLSKLFSLVKMTRLFSRVGSQGACFNLIINWWFLLLISILARTTHLDMYMIVEREEMSKIR